MQVKKILLLLIILQASLNTFAQVPADTVCAGDTSLVTYFISNTENGVTYEWALDGGGTVMASTNDSIQVKWGTAPGLYNITVNSSSASGCIGETATYSILVQEMPAINLKPASATVCPGAAITIRASGADTYTWSPAEGLSSTDADSANALPDTTTTYTVTGNSGGCLVSKSITITRATAPVADFTFEQTGNYILQMTSTSIGAVTYLWDFGVGNTSTEENPVATYPFDGDYTVSLTVENACGRDTIEKVIDVIKLGFGDITGTQIVIGPNPVSEQLWLKINMRKPENLRMKLLNILGQQLSEQIVAGKAENLIPIDIANYAKGIYYLQFNQGNEQVTFKVVKQ